MMTMYASSTGPVPIPAKREAPPERESKPPPAATIAIVVTPTGALFKLVDYLGPKLVLVTL